MCVCLWVQEGCLTLGPRGGGGGVPASGSGEGVNLLDTHTPEHTRRPLKRAVQILLECILVIVFCGVLGDAGSQSHN